jgi:hypothetical protein
MFSEGVQKCPRFCLDYLNCVKMAAFKFNLQSGKQKSWVNVGTQLCCFLVKEFPSEEMKCDLVRCCDATIKVQGEVFANFHIGAVKRHSIIPLMSKSVLVTAWHDVACGACQSTTTLQALCCDESFHCFIPFDHQDVQNSKIMYECYSRRKDDDAIIWYGIDRLWSQCECGQRWNVSSQNVIQILIDFAVLLPLEL